jgi:hypothetical protein
VNAVVVIENIESQSSRQQFCDAEWQRSQMRCKGHNKPLEVIEKKMETHLIYSYLFKLYTAVGGSWRCRQLNFDRQKASEAEDFGSLVGFLQF